MWIFAVGFVSVLLNIYLFSFELGSHSNNNVSLIRKQHLACGFTIGIIMYIIIFELMELSNVVVLI